MAKEQVVVLAKVKFLVLVDRFVRLARKERRGFARSDKSMYYIVTEHVFEWTALKKSDKVGQAVIMFDDVSQVCISLATDILERDGPRNRSVRLVVQDDVLKIFRP